MTEKKKKTGKPHRFAKGEKRPEGAGRKAGTPNKFTTELKTAILEAAHNAGGKAGLVGYLEKQAKINPVAFLALLGKTLPLTLKGSGPNGEIQIDDLATARSKFMALLEGEVRAARERHGIKTIEHVASPPAGGAIDAPLTGSESRNVKEPA